MVAPLAAHGIATVAVPLPSCGEAGEELCALYADVDACRRAIAQAVSPVIPSVMADAGQSQGELIGSEPARWLDPSDDGTIGVHADLTREYFPAGLRRGHDRA